jgi:hypothetical protein
MFNAANQASIFVPMLAIVALTFIGFIRMAQMRGAAVKGGQPQEYYKAQLGAPEPEATVVAVRHFNILFEVPTLFYAACLTAYVLGGVGMWTLIFAWAFAVIRLVQSAVHLTGNNTGARGGAMVLSMAAMLALWINIGMEVCGKL